jgi:hypothetical protein
VRKTDVNERNTAVEEVKVNDVNESKAPVVDKSV